MVRATDNAYTLTDLHALQDDGLRYELARGRLICEPPPGGGHGRVAARLVQVLSNYVDKDRSGVVLTCDPGFILARDPDTVRAPDIAYVTWSRYRALRDDKGLLPLAPDLAVEVLSPNDRPGAIAEKLADFFDADTKQVWLVDPHRRQVTVHQPDSEPQVLQATMTLTAPDLLPGFEVRVSDIFRSPFD